MASRTPQQITSDIISKLAITAPGFSAEIGTPERKIIDVVAETLSETQIDNYLNSTALDIDTKSGADLEDYVGIFGFGRLQGNYARGQVTVSFNIPAVQSFVILAGTQFFVPATSTQAAITYNSTSTVTFNQGDSFSVVPIQCAIVGTIGNVSSGSVSGFSSGQSFSNVTNINPLSGGTDDESDESLRSRFKKTILRNIAGTEDFYIALCLQVAANGNAASSGVSKVKVMGPVSEYTTQISTGAIGTPVTVPSKNVKYIWAKGDAVSINAGQIPFILTNISAVSSSTTLTGSASSFSTSMIGSFVYGTGIPAGATIVSVSSDTTQAVISAAVTATGTISVTVAGETWFTSTTDYSITSGAITAPVFTPLNSSTANTYLDIRYEYNSISSRNNPVAGIANKIDIFVDGQNPQAVTEYLVTAGNTLSSVANQIYNSANFALSDPNSTAVILGKKFQRLGSTPILSWPTSLIISGVTKVLGTDYIGVYDITTNGGSERDVAGIVWLTTAPADGIAFVANYTYNQTPQILNAIIKKQKQITTDVLVHQATVKQFGFVFVIQYSQGYSPNNVNNDIITALRTFFNGINFGGWIQLSDILQTAHNVNGVDNVRMAHTGDATGVTGGLYLFLPPTTISTYYTTDLQLEDNTLAALYVPNNQGVPDYGKMFIRRSFNTFGS